MNSPVEQIKNEKKTLLKRYVSENKNTNWKSFAQNRDAIFVLDLEGKIVEVNSAFVKMSKYSVDELENRTFQSLFTIDHLDKVYNHFHKAMLGQVENFDCIMESKNGPIIHLNIIHIPIHIDDQVVGIYSIAKDITQLKRKREENKKIEDIHIALTDYVLDIIVSTNLLGNIRYISPSCQQILGFSREELVNEDLISFVHPEDLEQTLIVRQEVVHKLINGRSYFRLRHKDGNYIWVEALCKAIVDPETQKIIEVVSVIRDMTERKQAEDALWSRKKAFRDLVEHSPDAVVIAKNEKIIFINETGANLFGISNTDDIISRSLLDFVQEDNHHEVKERIKSVVNGNSTDFKQYPLYRLDGTSFDAEVKGIPTFFQNQSAQHIIIRDITERKKTEELILNSEKLTVAGQLAAGIAHEVRNPLTAIKGFLQLMEAQSNNKTYFDIIQSEMNRIEHILSELLVLAKPQDLKFGYEKIHVLIEEVKTLIDTHAIMNNILIEVVNECKNITIKCDKNQLKQVFINFLKNSIEAMPEGGEIMIEIKKHGEDKVKIFFKDTGVGIPQPILERIGQPFFTTKENGTGLGLMISKQIIENHQGNFNIWSDNKGTIIELILPI